jgi:flavin-dependent dehydrogenase
MLNEARTRSPTVYDAIVIGARCAGSPTAMLLARRGYKVLLVDRASFPSDMLSGHYIHQPGGARLKKWGLLDRVARSGGAAIRTFALDFGPTVLVGSPPPVDGVRDGYCVRRTVLDKLLVDAAVEAGAELRERFPVQSLLMEGERVVGIRAQSRDGIVEERARLVIGADGPRSLVARAVHAPASHAAPSLTVTYYSYWSGIGLTGGEFYAREGIAMVATPTNDGLTAIGAIWPVSRFAEIRADVEGSLMRELRQHAPALAARVAAGRREARFAGTADAPFFMRRPYGPGWALVGDAGYHRDAITAQGITDAFRDADLLVEAADAELSGRAAGGQAMAAYHRQRDAAVMPMYDFTYGMAKLEPPTPELRALLEALPGNQPEISRFMGVIAGSTSIPEYFSPENLAKVTGSPSRELMAA